MDVLQRDKCAAVMQLALQQADVSAVFRAAVSQLSSKQLTRALLWRNKSQEKDACIGTLSHKEAVSSEASAPHASSAAQATPSSWTTPRARSCSRSSRAQVRFRASPSETGTSKVWDHIGRSTCSNRFACEPTFVPFVFRKKVEGVVHDDATIRLKDGGGAFYAPSPISLWR